RDAHSPLRSPSSGAHRPVESLSEPESSPLGSRVFGGVADATQEFLRVIVPATAHRLADGETPALARPPGGAPLRRLEVQLRLQPQPRHQPVGHGPNQPGPVEPIGVPEASGPPRPALAAGLLIPEQFFYRHPRAVELAEPLGSTRPMGHQIPGLIPLLGPPGPPADDHVMSPAGGGAILDIGEPVGDPREDRIVPQDAAIPPG